MIPYETMAVIATEAGDPLASEAGEPLLWVEPIRAVAITRLELATTGERLDSLELVHGWTGPLELRLTSAHQPVPLHGCDVGLRLGGRETPLGILDPASGAVRWAPEPGEVVAAEGPQGLRVRVVDAAGRTFFFPSRRPLSLYVRAE